MGSPDKENVSGSETQVTRRGFLKKAAYTAPALIALGQLTATNANAIGPPVSQPGPVSTSGVAPAPPRPSAGG